MSEKRRGRKRKQEVAFTFHMGEDPSRCKYADAGCVEPAEHTVGGERLCEKHFRMWRELEQRDR